MQQYASAYKIRYRSLRRLSQDHETHITHGGILVPKSGQLPAINTKSLLRLETPSGAYFDFPALVVREIPGQGFIAAFEPAAKDSQLALDELIITDDFKAALSAESAIEGPPVAVIVMDLDQLYSKPEPQVSHDTLDDESPPVLDAEALSHASQASEASAPRGPEPGEKLVVYVLTFQTLLDYQPFIARFAETAILELPYANETAEPDDAAELRINLPGKNVFNVFGRIHKVTPTQVEVRVGKQDPAYQSAVSFPRTMRGQKRLASEHPDHQGPIKITRLQTEIQKNDDDKMPLRRRLQRMSMDDKVNLALSGDREVRMALASDGNKAIHHYLLKNARISMDEIVMMARLPTLNPDVLKKIGENPAYTQNPQIVKNLVFNPKTPAKLAVRLIDRLPKNVLNMIAKRTSMNRAIVNAAQKKLGRKS